MSEKVDLISKSAYSNAQISAANASYDQEPVSIMDETNNKETKLESDSKNSSNYEEALEAAQILDDGTPIEVIVDKTPAAEPQNSNNLPTDSKENIILENGVKIDPQTFEYIKKLIENEIEQKKQELNDEKENRGVVTSITSGIKGIFGGGDAKAEEDIKKLENAYKILETNPALIGNVYQTVMGEKLDAESVCEIQDANQFVNSLSDDAKLAIVESLEQQLDAVQDGFDETKEHNGIISGAWDVIKNFTGIGASSNKTQTELDNARAQLEAVKENPTELLNAYKNITGKELTSEEFDKLYNGETSLQAESKAASKVARYQDGQSMATDVFADVATGFIAIALAPATGGASFALTAGCGAASKVIIKGADALTGGRKYGTKDLIYDAGTGAVNGLVAKWTAGFGSASSTAAAKASGMPMAQKLFNSSVAKFAKKSGIAKFAKKTSVRAAQGFTAGAADGTARALLEGRSEDIPKDALERGIAGAEGAVILGAAGDVLGAGFKKLKGKPKTPAANNSQTSNTQNTANSNSSTSANTAANTTNTNSTSTNSNSSTAADSTNTANAAANSTNTSSTNTNSSMNANTVGSSADPANNTPTTAQNTTANSTTTNSTTVQNTANSNSSTAANSTNTANSANNTNAVITRSEFVEHCKKQNSNFTQEKAAQKYQDMLNSAKEMEATANKKISDVKKIIDNNGVIDGNKVATIRNSVDNTTIIEDSYIVDGKQVLRRSEVKNGKLSEIIETFEDGKKNYISVNENGNLDYCYEGVHGGNYQRHYASTGLYEENIVDGLGEFSINNAGKQLKVFDGAEEKTFDITNNPSANSQKPAGPVNKNNLSANSQNSTVPADPRAAFMEAKAKLIEQGKNNCANLTEEQLTQKSQAMADSAKNMQKTLNKKLSDVRKIIANNGVIDGKQVAVFEQKSKHITLVRDSYTLNGKQVLRESTLKDGELAQIVETLEDGTKNRIQFYGDGEPSSYSEGVRQYVSGLTFIDKEVNVLDGNLYTYFENSAIQGMSAVSEGIAEFCTNQYKFFDGTMMNNKSGTDIIYGYKTLPIT